MSGEPRVDNGALDARERVLAALRGGERFVLATHEHPDGDALGSLVAMQGVLTALGKDSMMYMSADEFPLSYEYRFFGLEGLAGVIPDDLEQRTVVFLDCGNIDRNPADRLRDAGLLINIDHHHDNTMFGTINLVVPDASSTAEIVWDLMGELGVTPDQTIADALYVGLVTDTGRFSYENTGPRAHRMAAELIEAGVDVQTIYRRLYEEMPYAKLDLLARTLARMRRFDDGNLTFADVTAADYRAAGAEESYTEGIVDHLRSIEGTSVAVLVRDILSSDRDGARKVSMRSTSDQVDVSAIAREQGGGGHRQAAGFTTELSDEELVSFLRDRVEAQLAAVPVDETPAGN